jgi:hypothetical protein
VACKFLYFGSVFYGDVTYSLQRVPAQQEWRWWLQRWRLWRGLRLSAITLLVND